MARRRLGEPEKKDETVANISGATRRGTPGPTQRFRSAPAPTNADERPDEHARTPSRNLTVPARAPPPRFDPQPAVEQRAPLTVSASSTVSSRHRTASDSGLPRCRIAWLTREQPSTVPRRY
uniref:Uncharacterized protein n=1 Tax=Plectus sambesii TaxID=2011161 RepID=A0A914W2Z9_9BILA